MASHRPPDTRILGRAMTYEYSAYPPEIDDDVEIVKQREGDRPTFIVGSASAGRFILLGETECSVLRLLTATSTPSEVCEEFRRLHGAKLTLATLKTFLWKLDEAGILAGYRTSIAASSNLMPGPQFYARWKLFNPDRLFEKMVLRLGWVWTKGFVVGTLLLMALALLLSMGHSAEVTSYAFYTLREHYLAVFLAGVLIGFSHEFAHGLTCKAFGGRVPEVGVLMIYYLLPALYCNVSGSYLIPERKRRLWVILAGIYWQVLVGALALLCWFVVEPHSLISDVAFIFCLGSVLDVIFNANPLIKLDGYYFLSQLLRLPNLMDHSRAYWSDLLKHGPGARESHVPSADLDHHAKGQARAGERRALPGRRERAIYAAFGLSSFVYTVALRAVIVFYVGSYLTDQFNIAGLMMGAGLGSFYMRQPLGQIGSGIRNAAGRVYETFCNAIRGSSMKDSEGLKNEGERPKTSIWRRRILRLTLATVIAAVLCTPWTASVGGYGVLVTIPGQEIVVRAPEAATLIELRAQAGDVLSRGTQIGRMGNLELEEQIVQVQSDLARANAEYGRLCGEIRARGEASARAELQLSRRRHEFDDISSDQDQINQRHNEPSIQAVRLVRLTTPSIRSYSVSTYPAAMAVLQADCGMLDAQLQEASARADRSRKLFNQGLLPRSEIESAETRVSSLSFELVRARERLEAALIEHRRKYTGSSIELEQASSDLRAERLQTELFSNQSRAARELIRVLESRLDLLWRKQSQFELVTPRDGTVYGEDLSRMTSRYFQKGEEICRVADTQQLLVRIQLLEREIGDVRVGHDVRLKVRAYPDHAFHGVVSKIGSESERDEHNQPTYRVELSIENQDGFLRPGMTAFARVDFDRQMIGQILVHKLRQLLRPELWML